MREIAIFGRAGGLLLIGLCVAVSMHAADVIKADSTSQMRNGVSWVGGSVPTATDTAVFDDTYTQAGNLGTGLPLMYAGLRIDGTLGTLINIQNTSSANFIQPGAGGIDMSASPRDLTIRSVNVAVDQTWDVATGRVLRIGGTRLSGSPIITKSGAGQLRVEGGNHGSFTGHLEADGGTLLVNGIIRSVGSLTANSGAILELGATNMFVNGHGTPLPDTRTLTADGGTLLMNGNMDGRIGNLSLANGGIWTSNRGLGGSDVLLGNVDSGAATVSVSGAGAATMNGTGGIHLQGVQNFNVADTTGDLSADLTVSMLLGNHGATGGANGGIRKQGNGTMLVTSASSYVGDTIVEDGVLILRDNAFIESTYVVGASAVLQLDTQSGDVIVTAPIGIDGGGTVLKTGNNNLQYYSAGSDIQLDAGGLLHVKEGKWTNGGGSPQDWINNYADLQVDAGADFDGESSHVYVNALIGGGTVRTGGGLTLGVGDGGGTFSGIIANDGNGSAHSLAKTGNGIQTLTGSSVYTGNTRVEGGTLAITGLGAIYSDAFQGSAVLRVENGGTLQLDDWQYGIGTTNLGGLRAPSDAIVLDNGRIQMNGVGDHDYDRGFTIGAGGATLESMSGANWLLGTGDASRALVINGNGSLHLRGAGDGTFGKAFSGNGSLTKSDAGTWVVTGAATHSGGTTVNGGTLVLDETAYRPGSFTVAIGATLQFDVNGIDSDGAPIALDGGGTIHKTGANELGYVSAGSDVQLDSGALIHVEEGRWRNGGGTPEDWVNNLSDLQVDAGAEFDGESSHVYVNALIGGGTVRTGGGLTLGVDDGGGTFSGIIANDGNGSAHTVTKVGTGTQVLSGANTHSGWTTANDGTLVLEQDAIQPRRYRAYGEGTLEMRTTAFRNAGGTIQLQGDGTFKKTGNHELLVTSFGSTVALDGGGLFHVAEGTFRFGATAAGDWSSNAGDLRVDGGATFRGASTEIHVDELTGGGTVTTGSGLRIGVGGGSSTFDGNVIDDPNYGSGNFLTKVGAGTIKLTGTHLYTGLTNIDEGTLLLNGTHTGGGRYTIASGATFGGTGSTTAELDIFGTISPGNSPESTAAGSTTFNAGSDFYWELFDTTLAAGTGWDVLNVTGNLTIDDATDFIINVAGIDAGDNPDLPIGLDISVVDNTTGPFTIMTWTGAFNILSGDLTEIVVNEGNLSGLGDFDLDVVGNSLQLTFTSTVPEPGTWALLGILLVLGLTYRRRLVS